MRFDLHTPVAFVGMGLMGSRMATRLIQAGFQVAVWNRTQSACDALLDMGAALLKFEDLGNYPLILTCVADDAAMHDVFAQIQPYLKAEQVIVDFSSLSVEATHQLAKQAEQHKVIWIDSPVSGGTAGAEQGTLVIFAGGDPAVIQDLNLLYNILSQRVTRMGDVGTGQATKICNQLIVAANSALIAEAVALAGRAGVDTTLLAPALANGFADSKPFQILTPRMAKQVFEPVQWKVQTLAKDLNNAVLLAQRCNLHIPVAVQALSQLQAHQENGYAQQDLATMIKHVDDVNH
ncbi:NAD(P)-dependent oxidoreductase [Acinetobacter soli]|uniref:NAD(P)-dependent oxidoreductase n=1 Tax=Acinetobacter soli TaxID=487316 RepID=UPI00287E4888|nr:NAD(P)-dependent oxidoreductase [Acinetobacter soli]MDS7695160.1 NAD(P)-dependent oxidoreductase [Acinetobacter soli]